MPPFDADIFDVSTTADGVSRSSSTSPIVATDGELLIRFTKQRDEDAFAELVDRHAALVWSVCQQVLRRRCDVEDAFQATFLILAQRASSVRASDSAAGWLYRVAHRTAVASWQDRRRRAAEPLEGCVLPADGADPLECLGRRHAVFALAEELQALPDRYRAPLVLCYLQGQSRRAAADALDCTVATIKGRLARGKRMLRGRLARRGVALSVAAATATAAVASAQQAVASTTLIAATANAATEFVASGAATASAVSSTSLSLAQHGASAMYYVTLAKPLIAIVAALAVGVTTVVATDDSRVNQRGQTAKSDASAVVDLAAEPIELYAINEEAATTDVALATPDDTARKDERLSDPRIANPDFPQPLVIRGPRGDLDIPDAPVLPAGVVAERLAAVHRFEPTTQQLELESEHWKLKAQGLERKAALMVKKGKLMQQLAESGKISAADAVEAEIILADALLMRADAKLAEAKHVEIFTRISQQKQRGRLGPPAPIKAISPMPTRLDAPDFDIFPGAKPPPRSAGEGFGEGSELWRDRRIEPLAKSPESNFGNPVSNSPMWDSNERRPSKHTLAPGDLVRVTIIQQDPKVAVHTIELKLDDEGQVDIPHVGDGIELSRVDERRARQPILAALREKFGDERFEKMDFDVAVQVLARTDLPTSDEVPIGTPPRSQLPSLRSKLQQAVNLLKQDGARELIGISPHATEQHAAQEMAVLAALQEAEKQLKQLDEQYDQLRRQVESRALELQQRRQSSGQQAPSGDGRQ